LHDLSRLGVAAERALGKDEIAVHRDLEHAAGRRHQAELRVREQLLQLSRQTGGSRLIVSDDTILYDDAHALPRNRSGSVVARIVASLRDPAKVLGRLGFASSRRAA
jgi:hypothetical protein